MPKPRITHQKRYADQAASSPHIGICSQAIKENKKYNPLIYNNLHFLFPIF
jgi:hypothetical protein